MCSLKHPKRGLDALRVTVGINAELSVRPRDGARAAMNTCTALIGWHRAISEKRPSLRDLWIYLILHDEKTTPIRVQLGDAFQDLSAYCRSSRISRLVRKSS